MTNFGNWTEDDTEEFASLNWPPYMNWRARLFFHSKERVRKWHRRLREMYEATGKQPGDLTEEERQKLIADLDYSWFERLIIHQNSFYYGIAFIIIISIAIISLDNSVRYKYPIPWESVIVIGLLVGTIGALYQILALLWIFIREFWDFIRERRH
jgi:hypothetical protein